MIDIQTALYNIMHSRHGRDVRQSLHDSIYQMNENANEALQKAKSMGVGTAVDSASSSTEGYVEGNLYLNTDTWDLWQCVGVNSWLNTGNVKGEKGDKGADGINNFVYIRYSAYYDGTDFTATPTASSQFIGLYYGTSATAPTNKQDYQWTSYVGSAGTNAYVYVRYSEFPDGTNFVDAPTALTKYIGFYAGSSSSAPANKASYVWSMYVGKDGEGSGDMREDIYAPDATEQGLVGTVDRALAAKTAETATDATNAENLKKSNGEILDVDTVSTKLQTVDEIIGGDEWKYENTYTKNQTCIWENKVYKYTKDNGNSPSNPSISTDYWQITSLSTIEAEISDFCVVKKSTTVNSATLSASWTYYDNCYIDLPSKYSALIFAKVVNSTGKAGHVNFLACERTAHTNTVNMGLVFASNGGVWSALCVMDASDRNRQITLGIYGNEATGNITSLNMQAILFKTK